MSDSFLTVLALFVFGSFIISVVNNMKNDKIAIIIEYTVGIILAIATFLFVLTQYLGVKFLPQ